jgi:endoglucanase
MKSIAKKTVFVCLLCGMLSTLCTAMEFGAWVGGAGQFPQPTKKNVDAFQAAQGRHVDIISLFALWNVNDWPFTKRYADIAEKNGSILLVTWMANGYTAADIVAGKADSYIRSYATGMKADGRTVWLRPLHEANGNWYDWGIGKPNAGNTEEGLVEAWRHIVGIFRAVGVRNAKWVWTATNEVASGSSFLCTYPGDNYVDYISIDGYNWGSSQSWSSWKSFEDTFASSYAALAAIDKPLFIAEVGTSSHGGDKAAWIDDMARAIPEKFPRLFAIVWFNQSKDWESDWAIDSAPGSLAAWKRLVATLGGGKE